MEQEVHVILVGNKNGTNNPLVHIYRCIKPFLDLIRTIKARDASKIKKSLVTCTKIEKHNVGT